MKRILPVLEWAVLLPLWRRVFKPKALQAVFAGGSLVLWLIIIAAVVFDPDGDEPEQAESANAVPATAGAVAEAEHVRVVLHAIADPWTSDGIFQQPAEGRRLVAFDVTIDFFDDDGTHNANPFHFSLTDTADFAYAEVLRGPEPMLQAVALGSGQKTRGWIAFEVDGTTPLDTLTYDPNPLTTRDIAFSFQP